MAELSAEADRAQVAAAAGNYNPPLASLTGGVNANESPLRVAAVTDVTDTAYRLRILDAALTELTERSIGQFTLERVAARAGVDVPTVRSHWPNTPELFTATLVAWGERHMPIPDTGTLRGDFLEFSLNYAAAVSTPVGRLVLHTVVTSPKDWDTVGLRERFREVRPNRLVVMVHRAIERGECPADVDPVLVTDLLSAGLCTPVLFYDSPISADYAERIVDLVLNGVLPR